jgi:flagellar motor protein MotB
MNSNGEGAAAETDGSESMSRKLLDQMFLAKAITLSREGRYREAESLLDKESTDPLILDLLARIRAQEGRLCDAEALWRKALELDPVNETYMAALRRISMISLTVWARFCPYLILGAVIAIAIFLTAITVSIYTKKQMAALPASAHVITDRAVQSISDINMQGILVTQEKDHTLLTFSTGLFGRNDRLTPEAKLLLAHLAQHIEPIAGSISVNITGVVDSAPMLAHSRYMDNEALGMARAMKVVEYMRNTSRLPADMFIISGQAEIRASNPSVSPEDRLRNRTVIMRISNRT